MLISFDGIDGSGKSTQIEIISEILSRNNFKVLTTKDPGGDQVSEQIRSILLNSKNKICDISELYLFLAARRQNYENVILPALEQDYIVLTDRFIASSYAYQGFGKSLFFLDNDEEIETSIIERSGKIPDLSIVLDLPIEIALKRIKEKTKDRMEQNSFQFFEEVKKGFEAYCLFYKNSYLIDANHPHEIVTYKIIEIFKKFPIFKNLNLYK